MSSETELADQIRAAEAEATALREKLNGLRERYAAEVQEPNMRKQISHCFKYRNCYSCPESDSDYWWLYARIVGVRGGTYRLLTFERDKYGKVMITEQTIMSLDSYTPITKREFLAAVTPILDMITKEIDHQ